VYAGTTNGMVPRMSTTQVWLPHACLTFGPRLRGGVSSGRGDGLLDTARRRQLRLYDDDLQQLRIDFNSLWQNDTLTVGQMLGGLVAQACSISPLSRHYIVSPVPRQPVSHHHLTMIISTSSRHELISPVSASQPLPHNYPTSVESVTVISATSHHYHTGARPV
jgi:hypothetical protein